MHRYMLCMCDIYPSSLTILGFEREYGLLSQFKANHVALLTTGYCSYLLVKPLRFTRKSGDTSDTFI